MINNKKAFTFIELIISISIIVLISVIAITSLKNNTQKVNNSKIEADSLTLKNALLNYKQENKKFPKPAWNINYFKADSSYWHSWDTNNFWAYGSITEKTIPKKYLDNLPLDPVTNQYYSYWKTLNNKYFEVASVIRNSETSLTKLGWTYPGEYWPISLIREYNGAFFISNQSQIHLPYNPEQHILTAKDQNWKIYYQGSEISDTPETLTLYFSDWSVSELQTGSTLKFSQLKFNTKENNLLTTVKLFLSSWEIFTKATALNPDGSDFQIYTSDTTAAVRWTIFAISKAELETKISVLKWEVWIYEEKIEKIDKSAPIKVVKSWENITIKSEEKTIKQIENLNTWEIDIETKEKLEKTTTPFLLNLPVGKPIESINEYYEEDKLFTNTLWEEWEIYAVAAYDEIWELEFKDSKSNQKWKVTSNWIIRKCEKRNWNEWAWQCNIDYWPKWVFWADNKSENKDWTKYYCKKYNCFTSNDTKDKIDINQWIILNNSLAYIDSSFIVFNKWIKGVFVDNQNNFTTFIEKDYLKYSELDLDSWNFAIEMSVRFPETAPITTRYLFQLGDYKLYLKRNLWENYITLKNVATNVATNVAANVAANVATINIKDYYDWNFHTITSIRSKNETNFSYILYIDWNKIWSFVSWNKIWSELFIWSKNDHTLQLNDIIDYVKIYKWED